MKCSDVKRLISDFSVGNLSDRVSARVQDHISTCNVCADELRQLNDILAEVDSIGEMEPPAGIWNGVHNRITAEPQPKVFRFPVRTRNAFALGAGVAVIAGAVFFGTSLSHRTGAQPVADLDSVSRDYVHGHISAASNDVLADTGRIAVVSAMEDKEQL